MARNWWESDPRFGKPGWTLVHDAWGSRFVRARTEAPRRKRGPSRNLRFIDLQPGAVLIHRGKTTSIKHVSVDPKVPTANDDYQEHISVHHYAGLAICEDRWFDPVAGQEDPLRGEMASVRALTKHGRGNWKTPHTLRGLAQQGYTYATAEQGEVVLECMAERARILAAFDAGEMERAEATLALPSWVALLRTIGLEP